MKKKIFACFMAMMLIMSLFTACGGSGGSAEGTTEYRSLYSADVSTLNYLNTTYTADMAIPANTEEWLIQYDSLGNVQPALAESWTTSEDGLVWTFTLRDAKWYDYKGEEVGTVTAQDFVNAAEYALKYDVAASYMFPAAKIKNSWVGYDALISGEVPWEEVGIKAIDDKTLEFTLEAPAPYFLSCLTYGCFAPAPTGILNQFGDWDNRASWTVDDWNAFSEALDGASYDQMWYCGAYYLSEYSAGEKYVLKKNPNYFEADQVYIDTLTNIYNAEAATLSGEMFQRGEVESASLSSTQAKSWSENDATKDLYAPIRVLPDYSYFWCFNFDPQFDAEYEPDNWAIAVNNENFRQSIMHGINRIGVIKISDELNAETLLQNTITPANFVAAGGTDYVNQPIFSELAVSEGPDIYFNEDLAKEYRDKAKKELEAAGATFPVKILMPYLPSSSDWASECTYMEKQLEELLGSDYIDIIVDQGPQQDFLSSVRRCGNYALLKCNYGCDYADPLTYADPFCEGNNYNFMDTSTAPETKAVMDEYYAAVAKADAITDPEKTAERYAAFAEAEATLIEHAVVVPLGLSGGYQATKLNPFESQYAPFGVSTLRYKGQHILENAMNTEMFNSELAKWEEARANAAQ